MTPPLEIRRLTYADLPQVIAIERRAFPTPWSLAMFVLELSKPSGICLAALRDGRVVGYLVCSRYDIVWHVMNVAVDPGRAAQGIATALLEHLFAQADKPGRAVHARGAHLERARRSRSTSGSASSPRACGRGYYHDNKEDALIMWRTAGAEARSRRRRDPRRRDELRRHLRRGRRRTTATIRSNVDRLAGAAARALRRRRARRSPRATTSS